MCDYCIELTYGTPVTIPSQFRFEHGIETGDAIKFTPIMQENGDIHHEDEIELTVAEQGQLWLPRPYDDLYDWTEGESMWCIIKPVR